MRNTHCILCVQGARVQLLNIPVCHDPAHDGHTEATHYNATLLNCAQCGGTYQVQGDSRSYTSS